MTVKERHPDCEDTQDIDLLGQILDKLEDLSQEQRRQGEELEGKIKEIREKLVELETNVSLIRQSQVEQGKSLANMRQVCDERAPYCVVQRGLT